MKKLIRNSVALTLLTVTAGSLSSCGVKRHNLEFWGSFGAKYSGYIENIVADINTAHPDYDIKYTTKGSYDGIKSAVTASLAKIKYPDIMTGYPDHFASYLGNDILIQLNDYVDKYNTEHGGDLLSDYYDDYMVENTTLDIVRGTDKAAVSALPFNKSTELMGYNGTFVRYCATLSEAGKAYAGSDLGTVPATWQDWVIKGPKYKEILNGLCGHTLYFNQDAKKDAYDFAVDDSSGREKSLDFTQVNPESTRVITWDSTDNMFITLIRQWGSQYTSLESSEMSKDARKRIGTICFANQANINKTMECMHFFAELNKSGVFGVASQLGSSYSSDAFAANKVMFMLCSSGGLSYNTGYDEKRFSVAPLPYNNADPEHPMKYVISQGADIAISDYCEAKKGKKTPENIEKAFNTVVELTTGENQARWCLNTGYYPCSKSATNSKIYQDFLKDTSFDDMTKVAYREGSVLNENYYMNKTEGWTKFVDPAFSKSAAIREEVKKVFAKVFSSVSPEDGSTYEDYAETYKSILNDVLKEFKNERLVTWEGK